MTLKCYTDPGSVKVVVNFSNSSNHVPSCDQTRNYQIYRFCYVGQSIQEGAYN